MKRNESTVFWGGVVLVVAFLNISVLPALAFLGWYVKQIPDKRLPLTIYLASNQRKFYDWLSDFFWSWFKSASLRALFLSLLAIGVGAVLGFLDLMVWWLLVGVLIVGAILWGLGETKYIKWDVLFWQAEPTARMLVGSEEYEIMSEEDKNHIKRNVVDSLVGINKATIVVAGGKIQIHNPPAEDLARFGGPGVLVVQEGHAVVLERGGRRSRIVGTGVCFLKEFERVNMVIPLAQRSVHIEVENLVTQDRVVVRKMELLAFTRLDPGDKSHENGDYPFDEKVINDLVWTPKLGPEVYDWSKAVQSIASTAARDIVARLLLDDLILASGKSRNDLRQALKDAMNRVTQDKLGVIVSSVVIGEIGIPSEARERLLKRWLEEVDRQVALIKAESERDVMIRKGEGEATALRRVEEIKANLREVLIRQLTDPILGRGGVAIRDPHIAIRYIEAIERLSLAIVRDDLTALRYVEALERITESEGNKTFIVGETKGILDTSGQFLPRG